MAHPTPASTWISHREAAQWLGVSIKTISRWMDRGLLTYTTDPRGHRLLDRLEVEEMACTTLSHLISKTT